MTIFDCGPDPDDDRHREIQVTPETPRKPAGTDDDGHLFTRDECGAIGALVAFLTLAVLALCYVALGMYR